MSIIDTQEEIVSVVDVNVEFNKNGLSVSVFIDDLEFAESVDYETMAYRMLEDDIKYDDDDIRKIASRLRMVADLLDEGIEDGRER